ncbi:MAG: peptidoglycan editing factor PgeF [Planctomycetales bacterium]|nr:peptidoglycan editing factor PgeF [Planctomycetales bacterium]
MNLTTRNGLAFFQFSHLARFADINHAIFTRNTGYSQSPFHSLNVGYGIGDDDEKVAQNRQLIAQCLGARNLTFVSQLHGKSVVVLPHGLTAEARLAGGTALTGDAMVTGQPETFLVIQVADCQSVLMYDPIQQVIANVHAGWRGSIDNILGRTVGVMQTHFGCDPGVMQVGIGPSLGPCCAEFIDYQTEIPEKFWSYKDADDHFDFWSISQEQLSEAGVNRANIECAQICTRCHPEWFFSYRGEKITGRFSAVIGLRPPDNCQRPVPRE